MLRLVHFALGVACLAGCFTLCLSANPPLADDEISFRNVLAVQQAMEKARYYLLAPNAKKAVEALEEQLPRINGNATYLRLLRDAYRIHIKELYLNNQKDQAKVYFERLCIIDPLAAQDPILRGNIVKEDPAILAVTQPAEKKGKNAEKKLGPIAFAPPETTPTAPATAPAVQPQTPAPMQKPAAKPQPSGFVALAKTADPFDAMNQRLGSNGRSLAQQLQEHAEDAFARKNFSQARVYYERAYQADPQSIDTNRDHWGYCILNYVVDQLGQPGLSKDAVEELRRLVKGAVVMSPKLRDMSQPLLANIDNRFVTAAASAQDGPAKDASAVPDADTGFKIQHMGKGPHGFQLAETAHFRIFHNQSQDFAEKAARVAEKTRLEMFRKWFGHDGVPWQFKCDLYLHATAQEYSRQTGESINSPGHSRIEMDSASKRVVSRRMDMHCDQQAMLETVLPHETTHTVLAGMFPVQLPRWADEGMACLTEIPMRVDQHRHNLIRYQKEGNLFSVRDLMQMPDYPAPNRISHFYAESVVLVEFLTMQHGAMVFTEFLRDGLREGYELSLRRHYSWNFADLESRWVQHLTSESNRLASR